jgi:membrane protein implicated in regulation of membrane protease activity
MEIPVRFREPVALAEASAFGVAGVLVALLGPWPWLAAVAGPLIAVVVLVISTWRRRGPELPELDRDIAELVHQWANKLKDGDPARAHADEAVKLADGIEDLILQWKLRIVHIDDVSAQEAARVSLRTITDFVTRSVDRYTDMSSAPVRAAEWSALVRHLRTAHKALEPGLDNLL